VNRFKIEVPPQPKLLLALPASSAENSIDEYQYQVDRWMNTHTTSTPLAHWRRTTNQEINPFIHIIFIVYDVAWAQLVAHMLFERIIETRILVFLRSYPE
jgi:hypothetical protein